MFSFLKLPFFSVVLLLSTVCFVLVSLSPFAFMNSLKIGSLNVNGVRGLNKREAVFKFIEQKKLTVSFLQEMHSDISNEIEWRKEWKGEICFSHGSNLSAGVAILFSEFFKPDYFKVIDVFRGRILMVEANFKNNSFIFINIYAPNNAQDRSDMFTVLDKMLAGCGAQEIVIIGGDWNCTVDYKVDRNNLEPSPQSAKQLLHIIESYNLVDVWRNANSTARQYTWLKPGPNLISMARLDRFYTSRHHLNLIKGCFISPSGLSDHCLITLSLFLPSVKMHSAYWHFNNRLLQDGYFKDCFKYFWTEWKKRKSCFKSLRQWWDIGKIQIKIFCQQYTENATGSLNDSMEKLEVEILGLYKDLESQPNSRLLEDLKYKKQSLVDLLDMKVQGALVRARFQGLTEVDKPTKFFFGLEKKAAKSRVIHCLKTPAGQVVEDPVEICRFATVFYKNLFAAEAERNAQEIKLFLHDLPQIPQEEAADLEPLLTFNELTDAMQQIKNARAPGLDGITVEFYKEFWSLLGWELYMVLLESIKEGLLPLSCRRAVITLLPKKGDLSYLKNWRPVSILCLDYKILSKALGNHLKKIME